MRLPAVRGPNGPIERRPTHFQCGERPSWSEIPREATSHRRSSSTFAAYISIWAIVEANMDRDIWNDRIGYEDGEWITWSDVARKERDDARHALYSNGDEEAVHWFEALLGLAHDFHCETGGHLNVYGEIGELFAAAVFGVRRHRMYAKGSDGRLGDDFVEVKTITPFKGNDVVVFRTDAHFSKVLIVRIDANFIVSGRLIARRDLPVFGGKKFTISWATVEGLPHESQGPAGPDVWGGWL